jgi:hypothetical protein
MAPVEPLKETQLHKVHASNPAPPQQHSKTARGASQPGDGQEQAAVAALARLRNKRAEQRLISAAHEQTNVKGPGPSQPASCSQNVAARAVVGTGTGTRRRAQIVTTAGSGMQRQAPSCSSSAACSVRGSLELQQQPLRQLSGLLASNIPAHGRSWGNESLMAVAGQQVTGTAGPAQQTAATPAKAHSPVKFMVSKQAGSGSTQLQVAGVGVDTQAQQPHKHPPQQQHAMQPARRCRRASSSSRSAGLAPQGQQLLSVAGLAGARLQGHACAAAATGALTQLTMGCGLPWQGLAAALAGAGTTAATGTGRNLEHRRQVQQGRYVGRSGAAVARPLEHVTGQLASACPLRALQQLTLGTRYLPLSTPSPSAECWCTHCWSCTASWFMCAAGRQ